MKSILIAGPQLDPTRTIPAFQRAFADLGIGSRVSLDPAGLEGCSGLLLPGGFPDVDPARYGEPLAGSQQVDPELDKAQLELLDVINGLFLEVNPIPVKEAMNQMGMDVGGYRQPLGPMGEAAKAKLTAALKAAGLV